MDDGGSDSVTNEGRNGVEVRETHPQPAHATLGRIQGEHIGTRQWYELSAKGLLKYPRCK